MEALEREAAAYGERIGPPIERRRPEADRNHPAGGIPSGIVAAANESAVDLVVMTTRARHGATRLFLGSSLKKWCTV
jgi:nucleotide-binding universal stress UspA family protein